jgi:hypothetical protein
MSTPKITRAIHLLFRQIRYVAHTLTKGIIRWLLRGLLVLGGKPFASKAGFVLPTTVLLLLVVTLTVGAISYRTYTRSQQATMERQQRVIYNAATPAIDRAKSKLEFLFNSNRDRRFSPDRDEKELLSMMLNDGADIERFSTTGPDPYEFPDEARIDINNDGKRDNAWKYETDRDGDGVNDSRVVYSIIFDAPDEAEWRADAELSLRDSTNAAIQKRARRLLVRNAPLSNNTQTNPACLRDVGGVATEQETEQAGWFIDQVNRTLLRKNFQVDAYVLPIDAPRGGAIPGSSIATLEFQQDRQANRGFRWAAWFRNDLEIYPGPDFFWNGAMHTEGNYFIADKFKSYLVSSQFSCLYDKEASQMTTPDIKNSRDQTVPDFQGQFVAGTIRDNSFSSGSTFDIFKTENAPPDPRNRSLSPTTDSVNDDAGGPVAFALDPLKLHTEDVSVGRITADPRTGRRNGWETSDLGKRMLNLKLSPPYLDDTFRADDRYGPKPRFDYTRELIPQKIGETITGNAKLTDLQEGLDGYWERQARKDGVRIIVGQRLELGDPAGWGGPASTDPIDRENVAKLENEPLRPWTGGCTGTRCNESRQRKSLWDNLAAVQATAVYHSAQNRNFPAACIATTVHPGTMGTLEKSATFENLAFGIKDGFAAPYNQDGRVISDFFRGQGTNGWQYSMPGNLSERAFYQNATLKKALGNLAYFTGDPLGGAPSFKAEQGSGLRAVPHPFPTMSMWGDFSMLRSILEGRAVSSSSSDEVDEDSETASANRPDGITPIGLYTNSGTLSPADRTTLHTAACMLGMLAYNLDYLNKFNYNDLAIADVLGKALPPNTALPINPSSTENYDDYFEGLRGHIRAIDALIYDTRPSNAENGNFGELPAAKVTVPDKYRRGGAEEIPEPVRRLIEAEMKSMTWIDDVPSQGSSDPETYLRLLEFWRDSLLVNSSSGNSSGGNSSGGSGSDDDSETEAENSSSNGSLNSGSLSNTNSPAARLTREINLARLIITKEQVERDRKWGFVGSYTFVIDSRSYGNKFSDACYGWYQTLANATPQGKDFSYRATALKEPLMRLCSDRPRYPILFSLFPLFDHGDVSDSNSVTRTLLPGEAQESVRSMVRDHRDNTDRSYNYLSGATTSNSSVNANITYKALSDTEISTIAARPLILPGSSMGFERNWTLPMVGVGDGITPTRRTDNEKIYSLIKVCAASGNGDKVACSRGVNQNDSTPVAGPLYRVPFKDSAFYNGREMMSVRTLDLDLDLMRRTRVGSDYWLPKSGIIYAYREDAVSEAHIVRPNRNTWEACSAGDALLSEPSCQMQTGRQTDAGSFSALSSFDPPLSPRGITPKPVDYFPDPDRRPHGFRLRNGAALWRGTLSGSTITDDADPAGRGLSFITDNPAYIQGHFNLHRAANVTSFARGDGLEEFKEKLNTANFEEQGSTGGVTLHKFYDRKTLETDFADRTKDQWRPAEILADAITLLSPDFCDGSIEDALVSAGAATLSNRLNQVDLQKRYGCPAEGANDKSTSYMNMNRPTRLVQGRNGVRWIRSNLVDSYWRAMLGNPLPFFRGTSPIFFSTNGAPLVITENKQVRPYDGSTNDYMDINNLSDRTLVRAPSGIQMNMIMVSGLVPSRTGQSYGGLHNFPRFIEHWEGREFFLSGAMVQLNFSTYATAPYDQQQIEASQPAPTTGSNAANEWIAYYRAPDRRWGFDVALKYAPPGPVAERFRSPDATRSEFYNEPPANDPYIQLLRACAQTAASCTGS